MMERFTDRARKVLELALREALQLGHNYVAPEHLLLALCREGESLAAQALEGTDMKRRVLELMRSASQPQHTYNITVTLAPGTDPAEVGRRVVEEIKRRGDTLE